MNVHTHTFLYIVHFLKILFTFREKGREGGREEDKQCVRDTSISCLPHAPLLGTWSTTQACALAGNQTGDPSVHRPVLNPMSHTSQGYTRIYFKNKKLRKQNPATYINKKDYTL